MCQEPVAREARQNRPFVWTNWLTINPAFGHIVVTSSERDCRKAHSLTNELLLNHRRATHRSRSCDHSTDTPCDDALVRHGAARCAWYKNGNSHTWDSRFRGRLGDGAQRLVDVAFKFEALRQNLYLQRLALVLAGDEGAGRRLSAVHGRSFV